jgi:hypothetical protein
MASRERSSDLKILKRNSQKSPRRTPSRSDSAEAPSEDDQCRARRQPRNERTDLEDDDRRADKQLRREHSIKLPPRELETRKSDETIWGMFSLASVHACGYSDYFKMVDGSGKERMYELLTMTIHTTRYHE